MALPIHFTGLIQVMYAAMQVVSRERVGFIGSVSMEATGGTCGPEPAHHVAYRRRASQ